MYLYCCHYEMLKYYLCLMEHVHNLQCSQFERQGVHLALNHVYKSMAVLALLLDMYPRVKQMENHKLKILHANFFFK